MIAASFQRRERFVLVTGAAAVALAMLLWLLAISGHGLGSPADRLATTVVLLYLCARFWAHAQTLAERGVRETLARVGVLSAPLVFLLLLAQTWTTAGIHLSLGLDFLPHLHVSTFTRLEWTADVAVFTLFFATAVAVWADRPNTLSALLSTAAYVVLGFLCLDLLAATWGLLSMVPQWRLVFGLFVLSVGGTILVATVRRIERLDETA